MQHEELLPQHMDTATAVSPTTNDDVTDVNETLDLTLSTLATLIYILI